MGEIITRRGRIYTSDTSQAAGWGLREGESQSIADHLDEVRISGSQKGKDDAQQ